jgi:hypothetical protein
MSVTKTTAAESNQSNNSQDSPISTTLLPTKSNVKVLSEAENGDLYLKVFLLGSERNGNNWVIDHSTIDENIKTAIGKPLIIYKDTGDEPDRFRMTPYGMVGEWPRKKGQFNHPPWDPYSIDHTKEMLKPFTVGEIKGVAKNQQTNDWWSMVKVTDDGMKRILKENPTLPFYVSPQLWRHNKAEQKVIKTWELTHLAIVSTPAFGVRATVQGSCSGDADSCTHQFLNASLAELPKDESGAPNGCGFCTYKAMKEVSEQTLETERTGRTIQDIRTEDTSHLTNSSNLKTEERLSDNNNAQNSVNAGIPNAATVQERTAATSEGRMYTSEINEQAPQNKITVEHKTYPNPETHTYRPNANPSQDEGVKSNNNNAPTQDKIELITRIEQEKAKRAEALQQLNTLARDNRVLASKATKYESEMAELKNFMKAEQAMKAENEIAGIVYNANLSELVPEDKKEEQIKFALSKGISPREIAQFLSPLYEAFDSYITSQKQNGSFNPEQVPQFNTQPNTPANASLNRRESRLRIGGQNNNSVANASQQQKSPSSSFSTELPFERARKLAGMYTPNDNPEVV